MDNKWVSEIWDRIDRKLMITANTAFNKIPYTTVNGIYNNKYDEDDAWWTNGFWPALMILMYSGTKKEQYLNTARHSMDLLDNVLHNLEGLHHDVGFMWNISSGMDFRLTGDKKERTRFLIAANYLMGRYNCEGEFIRAWNGDGTEGYAIIDCMMNLPLLYRATEELKDERFAMIARKHANKTMMYQIRPDGSCNHINHYNPQTGEFLESLGGQGYCKGSSWSRGQAWGLYGFALSYKYTKDISYLDTAKKIAHYFIACLSDSEWLPLCDFRQPEAPVIYDSTAGACAACGLLEIAEHVGEFEKSLYKNAAIKIIKAMESKFCDWTEKEDAILLYGTEAYERGIHMPIIYGDYFFVEAIYRLMNFNTDILW